MFAMEEVLRRSVHHQQKKGNIFLFLITATVSEDRVEKRGDTSKPNRLKKEQQTRYHGPRRGCARHGTIQGSKLAPPNIWSSVVLDLTTPLIRFSARWSAS